MQPSEPKAGRRPRLERVKNDRLDITENDVEIIRQVWRHRFLTSNHIMALVEMNPGSVLRRLTKLYHAGYLDRPKDQPRARQQSGVPMAYALGNKGADLLAELTGQRRLKVDWTTKNREAGFNFIEHTLMVSNFMVCLDLACRSKKEEIRLIWSEEIQKNMPRKKVVGGSPFGWKVIASHETASGVKKDYPIGVIPDQVFGLHFPKKKEASFFFLEADQSTMPLVRSSFAKSSYLKKLVAYWGSKEIVKDIFGFSNYRVLTLAISKPRIDNMIQVNKTVDDWKKGLRMFYFSEEKNITVEDPSRILSKIWRNGRDEQMMSLLDS